MSGGAPAGSTSNNAISSARRWGGGRPGSVSSSVPASRSLSAANASWLSATAAWQRSTRCPASPAISIPARHSVVLPIPASPSSTSAAGSGAPAARNARRAASSGSRPTTASANRSSWLSRIEGPPQFPRRPGGRSVAAWSTTQQGARSIKWCSWSGISARLRRIDWPNLRSTRRRSPLGRPPTACVWRMSGRQPCPRTRPASAYSWPTRCRPSIGSIAICSSRRSGLPAHWSSARDTGSPHNRRSKCQSNCRIQT